MSTNFWLVLALINLSIAGLNSYMGSAGAALFSGCVTVYCAVMLARSAR
jgi:hypothetical protein